ncbi:MAG: dTDP-4-dehydrorhamnose 3,5-epimerase family protein, partial [Nitrospirota bacterium]
MEPPRRGDAADGVYTGVGRPICRADSRGQGLSVIFQETALKGAFVIDLEKMEDGRGFFARTWCADEFAAQGLNSRLVQCSLSFNRTKGTLRG